MSSPTETRNIQEPQEVEEIKREEIIPKVEDPVHIELFPVLSESIDYILGLPAFPDTLQVNFNKLTPINQCRRQKMLPDNFGGHPIKNQDDYYVIMMGFLPKTSLVTVLGKNKVLLKVITHCLRLLHNNETLQFKILDKKNKAPREIKLLTIMKQLLPVFRQPENDSKDEIFSSFIQYLFELQPGPHSDNNYRVARDIRHQGISQKVLVKSGETFHDSLGILLIKIDLIKSVEEFERTHNTHSNAIIPNNNIIHIE
ncbi:unnamed protein product [Caenorhabditis angaria]|uniref:Uncharacterized protein n=1 Tax=Caenorhabditis angaria TaxID=860376 RepID=A0A9P1IXF9_9PELO|nr:unnamed protein product [Caenorhabditis angaria]